MLWIFLSVTIYQSSILPAYLMAEIDGPAKLLRLVDKFRRYPYDPHHIHALPNADSNRHKHHSKPGTEKYSNSS